MTTDDDPGLTLVELVVVVSLLGLVMTVLAATVSVVLRTAPSTQFRTDDARSVRAIQTWLARDVASTPPRTLDLSDLNQGGYVFSDGPYASLPSADQCGAGSENVLHMTWADDGVRYNVNYRLIDGRVERKFCTSTGGELSSQLLGGRLSSTFCSVGGFDAQGVYSYGSFDSGIVRSVETCMQSTADDDALLGGNGATQNIWLSVSSRNYVTGAP